MPVMQERAEREDDVRTMVRVLFNALLSCWLLAGVPAIAFGQDRQMLSDALAGAVDSFERALPTLAAREFDVPVGAYRDALTLQRFQSDRWGGTVSIVIETQAGESGACARYAAFTRVPPADGVVPLVLCPRFWTPGADRLRQLTILHEMVHAVAGTDECQAMAFAARIEQAASGDFTPVDAYWAASGCVETQYRLPR